MDNNISKEVLAEVVDRLDALEAEIKGCPSEEIETSNYSYRKPLLSSVQTLREGIAIFVDGDEALTESIASNLNERIAIIEQQFDSNRELVKRDQFSKAFDQQSRRADKVIGIAALACAAAFAFALSNADPAEEKSPETPQEITQQQVPEPE